MKPRDSSEEDHGLGGELRAGASGVVAAPGEAVSRDEDDDKTTVDLGRLPMADEGDALLARRIRHALGQTLPLGTPVTDLLGPRDARSSYSRTMILGGRQSPGLLPGEPPAPPPARPPERRERASRPGWGPPPLPPSSSRAPVAAFQGELGSEPAPDSHALRASFVRQVGLPTAPPPRRSRRPSAAEELEGVAGEADQHEAFALDRPLTVPPPLPGAPRQFGVLSPSTVGAAPTPERRDARFGAARREVAPPSTSVMLPPPPQPSDYEPASSPSSLPPAPRLQPAAAAVESLERPLAPRVPVPPLLSELPSVNPFEGFEAPRESFAQRFLIVFVVALAVVGMFALAAIAFGLLGKTPLW